MLLYKNYQSSKKIKSEEEFVPAPTEVLPTVDSNIDVKIVSRQGGRSVDLLVLGIPQDIDSVEYELTYLTGSGLARGVLGKIKTNGESKISKDDIVLGTCSSGKCVYDTGVKSIDLSLKFNSEKGSSVFQKSFPL